MEISELRRILEQSPSAGERMSAILELRQIVVTEGSPAAIDEILLSLMNDFSGAVVVGTAFMCANLPGGCTDQFRDRTLANFRDAGSRSTSRGAPLLRLAYIAALAGDVSTLKRMRELRPGDNGVDRIARLAEFVEAGDAQAVDRLMAWSEGLDKQYESEVLARLEMAVKIAWSEGLDRQYESGVLEALADDGAENFRVRIEAAIEQVRQAGGFDLPPGPAHLPSAPVSSPIAGPTDEPTIRELASRAAHRRWHEPDFAEDLAAGSRKCDLCPELIPAGEGFLIEPALPSPSGATTTLTGELAELNEGIGSICRSGYLTRYPCARCGLELPPGGFAIHGIGVVQRAPQAAVALYLAGRRYFDDATPEEIQRHIGENALVFGMTLGMIFDLWECPRCHSNLCRRCRKLPHDDEGCVICSATKTTGARVVCGACFDRHDQDAPTLRTRSAIWAGRPDLANPTSTSLPILTKALDEAPADVAAAAREALTRLTGSDVIDALCDRWMTTGDESLRAIIASSGYVACQPTALRVRTALLGATPMAHLAEGGEELVVPLLELADGTDSDMSRAASAVLEEHPAPAVRDGILQAALVAGNAIAMRIARHRGYVPNDPDRRALFLFLGADWPAYRESDPDRSRLRTAVESASEALQRQLQEAAESGGRLEWIEAVLGGPKAPRLAQVTDPEWDGIHRLLTRAGRWAGIWTLARCAPLGRSLEFLKALADSGWQPEPAHRPLFDALTGRAKDYDRTAWDAPLPAREGQIKGSGYVRGIAISPRGDLISTVNEKDDVKLWSTRDFSLLRTLPVVAQGKSQALSLRFAIEGQALVAADCGETNRAVVWSVESGRRAEFPDPIWQIYIYPTKDGKLLALVDGGPVRAYDIRTRRQAIAYTCPGIPAKNFYTLLVSEAGDKLVSFNFEKQYVAWRLRDGQVLASWKTEQDERPNTAHITQDGKRLVTSHLNARTIVVWTTTGERLQSFTPGLNGHHKLEDLSPDDSAFALASVANGRAGAGAVYAMDTGAERFGTPYSQLLRFTPDGRWLLATGEGRSGVFSVADGRCVHESTAQAGIISTLCIADDGRSFATGSMLGDVRVWDLRRIQLAAIASLRVMHLLPTDLKLLRDIAQDESMPSQLQNLASVAAMVAGALSGRSSNSRRLDGA